MKERKIGPPNRKLSNRLAARQKGFTELMAMSSDSKVEQRKESGGYTLPGSMKKKGGL